MTARKRPSTKPGGKSTPRPAPRPTKPAGKPKPATKSAGKPAAPAAKTTAKPAAGGAKVVPTGTAKDAPPPRPAEKPPARGQLLPKLHKALRAHYKPFVTDTSRDLLHQVLFACCLENAPLDVATRSFKRLLETYADLNEVRVTTVAELAEALQDLPDPARAALSLRRALQGVFESTYTFSLEHARKHSLAHGIKVLEGLHGVPSFVIQHVAATGLGSHAIPLDKGGLAALWLCGIVTQQEYDSGRVTGLERVIGKKAGVEFSSLLHQFGIDVLGNLHGNTVRKIVQAVNPVAARERFPKRGERLAEPMPPVITDKAGLKAADAARAAAEELRPAGPQAAARPAGKTPLPPPGSGPKKPGDGKGKSGPKPFVVKPLSIKPPVEPPPPPPPPPAVKKAAPAPAAKVKPAARHSAQLSKRKPR